MIKTKTDIINEINTYMNKYGGLPSSWYVGITADAPKRLFVEHQVDKNSDAWIYTTAGSSTEAREIEKYFIEVLHTDGGTGGGDWNSNTVYAYKKNSRTNP